MSASRPPLPPRCPDCDSRRTVPIQYGFPDDEARQAAREGKIELGGCVVEEAEWRCRDCLLCWPASAADDSPFPAEPPEECQFLHDFAALPASEGDPVVERHWDRAHGRRTYLLRLPWGVARVEKHAGPDEPQALPRYRVKAASLPPDHLEWAAWEELQRALKIADIRYDRHEKDG